MNKGLLTVLVVVGVLAIIVLAVIYIIRPWYMRWGATDDELKMSLPGDELKPTYEGIRTRAITIQAPPEKIYPWLVQMGQGRAGLYSLEALENLVGMEFKNADSIHPEWQDTQIGDLVRMGPDGKAPPAYQVAALIPNQAFILGHQEANGTWFDTWQFVLNRVDASTTRLVVRSRYDLWHNAFDGIVEPMTFMMERAMLYGIKERAE